MKTLDAASDTGSSSNKPLLQLNRLSIGFGEVVERQPTVHNVSLTLRGGETAALVGESGSGKTLLAKAILGLLPANARIVDGSAQLLEYDLMSLSPEEHRMLRGPTVGIILQEPLTSLNPALTIGTQLMESLFLHQRLTRREALESSAAMLERVGIDQPLKRLRQYPHEFSGGMRQRIMIAAMALLKPKLLIADEPTTAVDTQAQKAVMALMRELVTDIDAALLLITHDLGVVADYAETVHVMESGSLVESGQVSQTLSRPTHAYTRRLLDALPQPVIAEKNPDKPSSTESAEYCLEVADVAVRYKERSDWPWSKPRFVEALLPVSLKLKRGGVLSIVGESGSGKTTLGRAIAGLTPFQRGRMCLLGGELPSRDRQSRCTTASNVQMIFQDPYSSLNPRWCVRDVIREPLDVQGEDASSANERVLDVMQACGLSSEFADRFPHELSGGQRQRVGIARALILNPDLIIADEPVSALDLTVQSRVLALLKQLQQERGFSLIFISHDLSVVEQISDRVVVMRAGRIVEHGDVRSIFQHATHPYTQMLLGASPVLGEQGDGAYSLKQRSFSARSLPSNCTPACIERQASHTRTEEFPLGTDHFVLTLEKEAG